MPAGGNVPATPATAYANRTDLNRPSAPGGGTSGHMPGSSRPYGNQTPGSALAGAGPRPAAGGAPAPTGGPGRPSRRLTAPSERPNEPITAGLGQPRPQPLLPEDPLEFLRVLAQKHRNPDVLRLLRAFGA